jgi:hypothetical protein
MTTDGRSRPGSALDVVATRTPTGFLKKLMLSFMVLGAIGTTVGAGTFASFNASTGNDGGTFTSGYLKLSDTVVNVGTCVSTGGGTTTEVDSNQATSCSKIFDSAVNAGTKRPGDTATADVTLQNQGSLSGNLVGYTTGSCTPGNVSGAAYNGSGNPCSALQFSIQEYSDAGRTSPSACRYGSGASAVLTGSSALAASAASTITIAAGTDSFLITVDGGTQKTVTLTQTGYTWSTLASEIQTKIRAQTGGTESVAVTTDGFLHISSATADATSSLVIANNGTDTTVTTVLKMTSGQSATGNATTCVLSSSAQDPTHTLNDFFGRYASSSTGLAFGTVASNALRYWRITMLLPSGLDDTYQGRTATFDLDWALTS